MQQRRQRPSTHEHIKCMFHACLNPEACRQQNPEHMAQIFMLIAFGLADDSRD
jgi:hypothetical protein